MKLLIAVCLVMCVGAAYAQIGVGEVPFEPHPVLPVIPARCYRRTWGYFTTNFNQLSPPQTNGNTVTYYFQCRITRPRWSECRGGCPSYDRFSSLPPFVWRRECDCCRAHRIQVVTPRAYCKYIFTFVNGCLQPVSDGVVSHPALNAHRYYLMDDCRCDACTSGQVGHERERRDVAGEITDLPEVEVDEEDIQDILPEVPQKNRCNSRDEQDRYEAEIPDSVKLCRVRPPVELELPVELNPRFVRT